MLPFSLVTVWAQSAKGGHKKKILSSLPKELVGASLAVLFILVARAARPLRLVPRRL